VPALFVSRLPLETDPSRLRSLAEAPSAMVKVRGVPAPRLTAAFTTDPDAAATATTLPLNVTVLAVRVAVVFRVTVLP
jgi:hypothetical protein